MSNWQGARALTLRALNSRKVFSESGGKEIGNGVPRLPYAGWQFNTSKISGNPAALVRVMGNKCNRIALAP